MNNINFLDFEPFLFLGKKFDDDCFIWIRNNFINKNYKDKENNELNYYSSLNDGISFCFKNNILDSIFYYNEKVEKYNKYKGKLPYNLNFDLKNINIVEYLGDTKKKGGGKYPIFLCYPNLGLEITFLSSNWNDLNNPIVFICIFPKNVNEKYCGVCTNNIIEDKYYCNQCNNIFYCSEKCKKIHITYHLKYCKKD
jgi:hypothetical protein